MVMLVLGDSAVPHAPGIVLDLRSTLQCILFNYNEQQLVKHQLLWCRLHLLGIQTWLNAPMECSVLAHVASHLETQNSKPFP